MVGRCHGRRRRRVCVGGWPAKLWKAPLTRPPMSSTPRHPPPCPPQVLEANKSVQAGLGEALEEVQQRLLHSWLRMKRARGERGV